MISPSRLRAASLASLVLCLCLAVVAAPAVAKGGSKKPKVLATYELPANLTVGGGLGDSLAEANGHLYVLTITAEEAARAPYRTDPIAEISPSGKTKLIKDTLFPLGGRWEGIGVGAEGKVWATADVHGEDIHFGVISGGGIKLRKAAGYVTAPWFSLNSCGGISIASTSIAGDGIGLETTNDNQSFGYLQPKFTPEVEEVGYATSVGGKLTIFAVDGSGNKLYGDIPCNPSPPGEFSEPPVALKTVPGSSPSDRGVGGSPVQTKDALWYVDYSSTGSTIHKFGSAAAYAIPGQGSAGPMVKGPDGNPWIEFTKSRSATGLARVNPDGKLTEVKAPHGWSFEGQLSVGPGHNLWAAAISTDGLHGAVVKIATP